MDETRDIPGKVLPSVITDYLENIVYPAWKEDFIIAAEDSDAPTEVLELLERIPDEEYQSKVHLESVIRDLFDD